MDLFNKIVDLLFREGGSSAPREPPGYRPVYYRSADVASYIAIYRHMIMTLVTYSKGTVHILERPRGYRKKYAYKSKAKPSTTVITQL